MTTQGLRAFASNPYGTGQLGYDSKIQAVAEELIRAITANSVVRMAYYMWNNADTNTYMAF